MGILVEGNKGENGMGEEGWRGVVGGGIFYCCSLSWSSLTYHINYEDFDPETRFPHKKPYPETQIHN